MEGSGSNIPSKQTKPPYGFIGIYEDFFKLLERIEIDKVDTSFLKSNEIAGGDEYKLISGLRFLDLIDEKGNAKDRMRSLRMVGDEFTKNFEKMVRDAYSDLFSKVDLAKALPNDIINWFITNYNMGRSSATQGAKIFVFLAQKANIPISTSLAEIKPEVRITGKKEKVKKEGKEGKEKREEKEGMHKIAWGEGILIYLKEGDKKIAEKAKALIDLYIEDLTD